MILRFGVGLQTTKTSGASECKTAYRWNGDNRCHPTLHCELLMTFGWFLSSENPDEP
jgi:hypothetical protein